MKQLPDNTLADCIGSLGLSFVERLLFELLLSRRGEAVSSMEINCTIFGIFDAEGGHTLDATVAALKAKLSHLSDVEICQLEELPDQIGYILR